MSSVPTVLSLVQLLLWRADQTPDAVAYVFLADDDGQPSSLTYKELNSRAQLIASHLQARQQSRDEPVLLLLHPGFDYIAAFFGCLYAGAIPVPAYPPTSARKLPRLQAVINDARAQFAITTSADMKRLTVLQNGHERLPISNWLLLDTLKEQPIEWTDPGASAESIAFLQYTSGSTGSPKGVMVSHGNLLKNIEYCGRVIGVNDADVTVSWLPPYHDFGLIGGILGPLFWGHRCIFMRPSSFLLNPYRWLKAISDYSGSISSAPNFAYDLCVRSTTPEQIAALNLASWRVALNGAEPVRVETVRSFEHFFGRCGFSTESMVPSYGLAESTLGVTIGRHLSGGETLGHIVVSKTALQRNVVELCREGEEVSTLLSVGCVLPDHEIAIVDPQSFNRTPANGVGEIWVRGPSVAQGYWKNPDATLATFSAFIAESGYGPYMRTGDIGFFHNNQIYICGRLKDLIIINGRNIYPQDVENASFSSHQKLRVDGATAFGVEQDLIERLVVVQELDFRAQPDDTLFGAIASAVAEEVGLPPDSIILVKAGQLPRTSSGKIQRKLCKKQFHDGALPVLSRWDRPVAKQLSVASSRDEDNLFAGDLQEHSQTSLTLAEVERWLIEKLAALVGMPAQVVDPRQPFAYYGLDSLASVQLAEEISVRMRFKVVPTVFWDYPSISQLALFLVRETAASLTGTGSEVAARTASEPIAIVGMGCRFPQADDIDSFWQLLEQGRGATGPVPPERLEAQTYMRNEGSVPHASLGGFLRQVDLFDPQFFGISPLEADRIDPQQRLVLEVAWEALESACVPPSTLAGKQVGVYVGISTHDYERRQSFADEGLTVYAATGSAQSISANRLSYLLDLRGPSVAVDTACSSSLVAVHLACQSLRCGESTVALAGGVNLILSSDSSAPFASAGMLAIDGRCKAFDAAADGYVRGEGCGIVVLKRLEDALRDGDPIRAVIRGTAVGQDGRSNGLIAPNGSAQVEVIRRALEDAQVPSTSIAYLEAHGTGTVLGDPIELRALKDVLLPGRLTGQACAIGSVKTNIGHLEAAAGAAGLIKTALALENGVIPQILNFNAPNPHCMLEDTHLSVPTHSQRWGLQLPHYAGVSSFGFGGTLAHVVLEQAPVAPPYSDGWPLQLLTLSARTELALEAMSAALAARIDASPGITLADVAFTHQVGRNAFSVRRMLVCSNVEDAVRALRKVGADRERSKPLTPQPPQLFFMFPGQGAQEVGMARELYKHLSRFRTEVDACASIVMQQSGFDIRELIGLTGVTTSTTAHQLIQTQYSQPALFVIEYAMARLWMSYGLQPQGMIGHSLGEYVAACLAGVFSLEEALALVSARGRLLQSMPQGAMLSVGMDEESIQHHLNSGLCLAAVNGLERCVVSGTFTEVKALETKLTAQGVSHRRLQTSHAFHSHLMDPALDAFGSILAKIQMQAPKLRFVSNLTGRWITDAEATSPTYWMRHMREPVRFAQGLNVLSEMTASSGAMLVEVGPGRTLGTLARQHADAADGQWTTFASLATAPSQVSDLEQHLETLGRLWLGGQIINWAAVYAGQKRRPLQLPTYPFERQRYWIDGVPEVAKAHIVVKPIDSQTSRFDEQSASTAMLVRHTADIERETCAIVAELLRIDPHKVDPYAPLLELGADSLILVQALNRIKKQFGITLSIRQLFEELTTISALAAYIAQQIAPAPTVRESAADQTRSDAHTPEPGNIVQRTDGMQPERRYSANDRNSMLERTIIRQLESLSQMTQKTSQILLQQLEVVKKHVQVEGDDLAATTNSAVLQHLPAFLPVETVDKELLHTSQFDPYAQLTSQQSVYLQQFISRFLERTKGSKDNTAVYKAVHADYRAQAGFRFSARDPVLPLTLRELFYPIVSERAAGSHIWDVDGNDYVDLTMGFGVHFFGHRPEFIQQALMDQLDLGAQIGPQSPLAGEVAQLVHELTGMERVAFCNSGTEAVILAIRLARTTTGRDKFVMFNGSYHGWSDTSLVGVDIDSKERGAAAPLMPGLTPGIGQHALVLEYADAESLEIIREHAHELAAVIVEPVQGRHPELQPREFLQELRALTKELGITLIFDEVITGFRVHPGGAQALFGVRADIATYGKAVGGGMPVGMVAGDARYLNCVDGGPRNHVDGRTSSKATFFAGSFSKHPLAMAASRAVLERMKREGSSLQEALTVRTTGLVVRINQLFEREQVSMQVVQYGSLFRLNTTSNLDLFCYHLVAHGLYIWEGRNMFLSTAHSDEDLDRIFYAFEASLRNLRDGGFLPTSSHLPSLKPGSISNEELSSIEAVVPSTEDVTLELTATQQGIWLECQLNEEASLAYNIGIALSLSGPVNHALLHAALQHSIDRHDSLRTVIEPSGERQHVLRALRIELPVATFAGVEDAAEKVKRWQDKEIRRPFDLNEGPLLRANLIQESAEQYLLCLTLHHAVSDGISVAVLIQEIAQTYSALHLGQSPDLKTAQTLRRYVYQRQSYLNSERCKQDESYWISRFAQMPPALTLPTDRPVHGHASLRAGRHQFTIGPDSYRSLQQVSGAHGCTLFMTLMAVVSVLLQRLTHQEDIVIGIPVAVDRPDDEDGHLIGCTLNMVPIRCRPQVSMSFSLYLAEVKSSLIEAYLHSSYPFALLTRKLGTSHDSRRRPLTSVLFNLDRPAATPVFDGVEASLAESPIHFGMEDLLIDVLQLPDQLIIKFQYQKDLFDDSTIDRMSANLRQLIAGIVLDASVAIGDLPMLNEEEKQKLISFNSTSQAYPKEALIHELFEARVAMMPHEVAVVFDDQRRSYSQVNDCANRLARHLRELGVGPDGLVAVYMERSIEMVVGLLAVLKAGGAYVPFDPSLPSDRLSGMLEDAQPLVVLTHSQVTWTLDTGSATVLQLDLLDLSEISGDNLSVEDVGLHSNHLAYVIYTSGSTGRPKGVMIEHRGVVNRLTWMQQAYGLVAGESVLQKTPFSFDVSVWEFFWTLLYGGQLVLAKPEGHHDPDYLIGLIARHRISTLHFVPSMLQVFLTYLSSGACNVQSLTSLKRIACSGEALSWDLQQLCLRLIPQARLYNQYGPTEAGEITDWPCGEVGHVGRVPIGRPIANTQIRILDARSQEVPIGVVGEIHIGGAGVARGYLNRPDLTQEKFVVDQFSEDQRAKLYKTGDLGRWLRGGEIEYLGRNDFQVKIRGVRIEPGEIEAQLATHGQVNAVVVVAREDIPGDKRLVAYVVAKGEVMPESLRAHLRGRLPEHMVPAAFVILDALPLNSNGKLDRKALPLPDVHVRGREYSVPQGDIEVRLATIWIELLQIEEVGRLEDFFEIGGHSLLATQLTSRIRQAFGINLPLRDVFENPTISELAGRLSSLLRLLQSPARIDSRVDLEEIEF